jgi:hypothetical protein
MRTINLHVFEADNNDTFKCPDCGSKVLVNTGYCVSCKKKVEPPKGKEKKEEEPDKEPEDKKEEPEDKKEPEKKEKKKEACKKKEEEPDDADDVDDTDSDDDEDDDEMEVEEKKKKKKTEELMTSFKAGLYSVSKDGVLFHGDSSVEDVFGEAEIESVSPEEFMEKIQNIEKGTIAITTLNVPDRRFWSNLEAVGVQESIVKRDNTFIIHRDVELKGTNIVLERGDVIRVL